MVTASAYAEELYKRMTGRAVVNHPAHGDLTLFKRLAYKRYEHAPHLDLLDSYLMQVTRYVETRGKQGIGRLIIAMPPRHGKTLTTSRLYPVWHLGRNPAHRVMLASYGQSLANKNSRAARNMLRLKAYRDIFPRTSLASDAQSVMEWDIEGTSGTGGADALGMGGAATGKGANVLIIDDPIKNREQAESETYRQKIWDSYTDDLYTRLEPGGAVIVMATRWHEDDLTGRLLKDSKRWTVLELPAICEDEGDALGRAKGEALWADRYGIEALHDIRDTLGPYGWSALYQQKPTPAEGGILKKAWFTPFLRTIPETDRAVRYWDLAMSEKTTADYTVGVRMEMDRHGNCYVTDVARAQVELADLQKFVTDVMLADGPAVAQGFENKGYMTRALQAVAKDARLKHHVIKGYNIEGDKMTRVLPFASRAALKLVQVQYMDWSQAYVDELAAFPNGRHDDQVDASSGAWNMLQEKPKERRKARVKSYVG